MSNPALNHIQHLSVTIGPRGSTTAREKEGHAYVQQVMEGLGCAPRVEPFASATSTYTPFILGLGVVLIAEALYFAIGGTANAAVGALAALVLSTLCLVCLLMELSTLENPLRWFLPTANSQNVIGVTPAAGETKRRVAVLAHVDSHRTPLIWHSRATFRAYRVISSLGVVGVVALILIYAVSAFAPALNLRLYSLIPAAFTLLAWGMVLQAHFTPYSAGANDNASGVGVLLAVAEKLQAAPLANTEVWWAATGCEEVGAYGSADFFRRHAAEFRDGAVIVVDNIAAKDTGPVYLDAEGVLIPARYPRRMLDLAAEIARARPELGGRAQTQEGAYTDGIHALKAGLDTLTFVGYTADGWIPDWHNPSDTIERVDAEAVERTEQFVVEVLRRLDAAPAG